MLGICIPDHVLVEDVDGKVVVALLRVIRQALYSHCHIRSLLHSHIDISGHFCILIVISGRFCLIH